MQKIDAFDYKTIKEERWNAITHAFGLLLSIPACVLLIVSAAFSGSAVQITAFSIFGATLILLFFMSTLLHSVPMKYKRFWSILDHSSIYVLIAGTYTPFLLIAIGGTLGLVMLIVIWSMAIFGVVFKCYFIHRYEKFSLALYIIMGWLIIFFIRPLVSYLAFDGFLLLLIGGVLFTFGSIFYMWTKLPYNHAIWHIFVIAGCSCMACCVYFYL